MPKDDSIELRKDRFFHGQSCAYCRSCDNLELDSVQPFTWVPESVWSLPKWDFDQLFVTEVQVLCDPCLRRKKQTWKRYKREGGDWIKPYISVD